MGTFSRAFSRQGAVDVEAVEAALQPKFALVAGPERAVSHTWLDTFDWRLHSAGISLGDTDDGPLIMQFPDGSRLERPRAKEMAGNAARPAGGAVARRAGSDGYTAGLVIGRHGAPCRPREPGAQRR